MANTLLTPTDVVRDANLILNDEMLVGNLVSRNIESRFGAKVGDTIDVKVPPQMGTADEFSSTTSASNVVETSVGVILQKHFYKRVDLTTAEVTQSLDDFNTVVTGPCVRALIRSVDNYLIEKIVGGYQRNIVGTAGTNPSTHAHILAAEQKIFDNRGNADQLVTLLTSTAHTGFAQLDIFLSSSYGDERPLALQQNVLGKVGGMVFFRSPNCAAFDRGDIAGTVICDGDPGTTNTISVDGLTAATGTIKEGTRFTCASDSSGNIYTMTADATIAGNAADLVVTPAADASVADSDAITFESAPYENVTYNPMSVAAAILPPAVMNPSLQAASIINGLGLRITSTVDASTLAGIWVFDLYVGAKVTQHNHGSVMQGS